MLIVVFGSAAVQNSKLYGMLFLHSNDIAVQTASSGFRLDMQGATIFGSLVVEGDIKSTGNAIIVYDDTATNIDPHKLPTNIRFARLPGSWLDRQRGF